MKEQIEMQENHIGTLFKNLRKNKKMSLNDVSGDLISLSFISKFERGESEISLSRFLILLNNLNVTIEEFHNLYQYEYPGEVEDLMIKVSTYFSNKDISGFEKTQTEEKERYEATGKRRYLYNSIMLKAFISDFTNTPMNKEDITILTDFLFGTEYWGKYELLLLGNSMPSIQVDSLDLLLKELIKNSEKVTTTEANYILKIDLLLNAIHNAFKRKRVDYAQEYIEYIETIMVSSVKLIYRKVLLDFYKAIIRMIKNNDEEAKEEITSIFKALQTLSLESIAKTMEKDYEYILEIYNI